MALPLGVDDVGLAPEDVVRRHAGRLLDSLPQLEDVVRLAAEMAGTSAAALNVVHPGGQETLAVWGMGRTDCSVEDSMCRVAVTEDGPVHVTDARDDPRFESNPWVAGPLGAVRFYCAQPVRTPQGHAIGTLCLFDVRPHEVDADVVRRLRVLADHVEELLDVQAHVRALEPAVSTMRDRHEELRRSNELLTVFARQVAHDLKAPVSTLRLSTGLLAEVPAVAAEPAATDLLRRIDSAGSRMDALISGFLALASLDGHTEWRPVDLSELLSEVVEDLGALARRHRIVMGRMPLVRGDQVQLRALLQNLVANAVVHSRGSTERVVRIDGGGAAEAWWVDVADSGPGIPVHLRDLVFEPLVRGETTAEGLGLGLAACRRIATQHNADIAVLDAPEGGALLRVVATPPVSAGAAAPVSAPRA